MSGRVQLDDYFRTVASHSPDFLLQIDLDGRILFINRAVPGRTRESMLGTPAVDWVPEGVRPLLNRALEDAIATGELQEYESYNPLHDGEPQWFACRVNPIVEDGTVTGVVLASRGITARKQREIGATGHSRILRMILLRRPLEETLRELCSVIEEQMPDLWCSAWVFDREARRFRFAGAGALPSELRGTLPRALTWPDVDDPGCVKQPVLILDLANDPRRDDGAGGILAAGVRACASIPAGPATDAVTGTLVLYGTRPGHPDERALALLESSADLAGLAIEGHRSDLRVRRLVAATESSLFGIACVDKTGRYVASNTAYAEFLGFPPAELLHRSWEVTVHPDDLELAQQAFARMLAVGRSSFEARGQRRDGTNFDKAVELIQAGPQSGFEGHYCMMQDVTGRREAERERDRLAEQLLQSQKMQAMGQLAGGIAHDFNNLLTVILGNTEILEELVFDGGAGQRDPRRALGQIRHAGERAATLTRQLLAFTRQQVRHLEVFRVHDLVLRMDGMLRRLLPETVRLDTRVGSRELCVTADSAQIEQVILNLAINARDSICHTGVVTIETGEAGLDAETARELGLARAGDYVTIAVTDTGGGMRPELAERVFEPFFTTKPTGQGTGLGLATVYGVVTQSEGVIHVRSEVGHGSTFTVYLPRAAAPQATAEARPAARNARGSETVLICEDETMLLKLARRFLERGGYSVLTADNGASALELAAAHPGRIDLLLTDVIMPQMNGRELARRMLERYPDLKVLFVSGYADDVISPAGTLASGIEFLEKPFNESDLQERVRSVLDS